MRRSNRRPDYDWRCHLRYRCEGKNEHQFSTRVIAPDEDAAIRIAERHLRNHPSRANAKVLYAEAEASMTPR